MPRHKHADVIIAWANGEDVQFRYSSDSEWIDWPNQDIPPCFSESYEYRVKPNTVTKKGEVVIYKKNNGAYEAYVSFSNVEMYNVKVVKRLQVEWEEEV